MTFSVKLPCYDRFFNTTPIIALSSIQRLDLLPDLFGHIHLVNEVVDECEAR
jgi:uncharacterized protein